MHSKGAEVSYTVLAEYWPVLLFLVVAGGLGIALLVIGLLAGPRRPESEKLSPYECGFEAFEDARMQFDVRYYLLAILFIIFDLEIAFLFPWAVVFQHIGIVALIEMALFLLLLVVGFAYVWKKGALEWE
jgi:NADH-quinone oxidoreductase subunit A